MSNENLCFYVTSEGCQILQGKAPHHQAGVLILTPREDCHLLNYPHHFLQKLDFIEAHVRKDYGLLQH